MQEAQEVELKPCPFCGSKNIVLLHINDELFKFIIKCLCCGIINVGHEKSMMKEKWNTRTKEGLNAKRNNEHTDDSAS